VPSSNENLDLRTWGDFSNDLLFLNHSLYAETGRNRIEILDEIGKLEEKHWLKIW
jgi:hypothetical protein